jgi:phage portal protein BeeE
MTLRSRLANARDALMGKAAPSGGGHGGSTGGTYFADAFRARRAPTPTQLAETYRSIIFACANLNAQRVAHTPLRLYGTTTKSKDERRPGRGLRDISVPVSRAVRDRLARSSLPGVSRSVVGADDVDEVVEHPLLVALDTPNTEMDRAGLLYYIALCLDVIGTAYVEPTSAIGLPSGFWPLQSQYVQPVPAPGSAVIASYTYFTRTYRADELMRFRLMDLANPYGPGYGPAQAAFNYANLEDKYVTLVDQLLGQGPRPSMIASAADPTLPPGEDERARYERQVNSQQSGPGAAGKILFTSGAWKFQQLSYNPQDIQSTGVDEYALSRIANVFGVPIALLSTDTNLANLQAAEAQHAKAVEFRCHAIASVLTTLARKLDPRLFFAFDPARGEDEERTARIMQIRLDTGVSVINEERLEQGLDKVDWGNEPWLKSTLRQPSEERPDPAAALLGPDGKPKPPGGDDPAKPKDKPKPKPTKAAREVGASDPFGPDDEPWETALVGAKAMLRLALDDTGHAEAWGDGTLSYEGRREVMGAISDRASDTLKAQFAAYLVEFGPAEKAIFGPARRALDGLFSKARKLVYRAVLAGTLALVGPTEIAADLQAAVVVEARRQTQFLQGFHQASVLGQQPLDGTFPARAASYGPSAWGPPQNAVRVALPSAGVTEERRIRGASESCPICVEEAAKGWRPVGTLRPIFDSFCRSACRCHFEYADDDGNAFTFGLGRTTLDVPE